PEIGLRRRASSADFLPELVASLLKLPGEVELLTSSLKKKAKSGNTRFPVYLQKDVDKFWRTARSAAVPGVALAVRLREMAPGIPVIIMSEAELPGKDQITCEGTIFKSCKSRFGERYRSQSVTTPPGTSKWNKIEH